MAFENYERIKLRIKIAIEINKVLEKHGHMLDTPFFLTPRQWRILVHRYEFYALSKEQRLANPGLSLPYYYPFGNDKDYLDDNLVPANFLMRYFDGVYLGMHHIKRMENWYPAI